MTERQTSDPARIRFRKMHGAGNDFVVIDRRAGGPAVTPALARAIGDRHRGVGFDQLAEIVPDETHEAAARLVFWNADGTTAGACGNATRCIADLLLRDTGGTGLTLRTERGLLPCHRGTDGRITVDMGAPLLDWSAIPLLREVDTAHLPLPGGPAACSMGNPHCTFFVADADAADLSALGSETETDPLFPERTNVQLADIRDRRTVRVRVWERGVGPTLASGSSACAVLVNAVRRGLMDRAGQIVLDGGTLDIQWRDTDGHVLMTGPVADVFEGVLVPGFGT